MHLQDTTPGQGAAELLRHAEMCLLSGTQCADRLAGLLYSLSIEVAISALDRPNGDTAGPALEWQRSSSDEARIDLLSRHASRRGRHLNAAVLKDTMQQALSSYSDDLRSRTIITRAELRRLRDEAYVVHELLYSRTRTDLVRRWETGLELDDTTANGRKRLLDETEGVHRVLGEVAELDRSPEYRDATEDALSSLFAESPALKSEMQGVVHSAAAAAVAIKSGTATITDADAARLVQGLAKIRGRAESVLMAHQGQLASAAAIATVTAAMERRRLVGQVRQAAGSGLTRTIGCFVRLLWEDARLTEVPVIVAADRTDQVYNLHAQLRSEFGDDYTSILSPDTEALMKEVETPVRAIIVCTAQALAHTLAGKAIKKLVVVTLLDSTQWGTFEASFQNGCFVFFDSHPVSRGVSLLGSYSASDAIREGLLVPVQVHSLPSFVCMDDDTTAIVDSTGENRRQYLNQVAGDIACQYITHGLPGKALVIARSIDEASALAVMIQDRLSTLLPSAEPRVAAWTASGANDIYGAFVSLGGCLSVVVSVKLWLGLNTPLVSAAFVTTRLSDAELHQLFALVARRNDRKSAGHIFDYTDTVRHGPNFTEWLSS